jgi:hypothetical protein
MPYTTVAAGAAILAATWNTNVRDQVISKFASAAARDAAITSPAEGMCAYLDDLNRVTVYDGTSWKTMYGLVALVATRTTDMTINNASTTAITWPNETTDTDGGFSAGGSEYTCPEDGVYAVTVKLTSASNALVGSLGSNIEILTEGTYNYVYPISAATNAVASLVVSVPAGQKIKVSLTNGTGANITDLQGALNIRMVSR